MVNIGTIAAQEAFEGFDLSWINGQSRYSPELLQIKNKSGKKVGNGSAYWDQYYLYNFNRPGDATHASSATMGRHGEFITNLVSAGIDYNDGKYIGRLALQAGNMLNLIQFPDPTLQGGGNTSAGSIGVIREAAVGYHFNTKYGMNIEAGLFPGFIGLEGYLTHDNWNYQRSFLSEMTPFYSSGLKVQYHSGQKTRMEFWVVNGWQSYHRWTRGPGMGYYLCHRPHENLQIQATAYHGWDTPEGLRRMHHDHSVVWRYKSSGNWKGAFSINNHIGWQVGTDVTHHDQHFLGSSIAHRFWNKKGNWAFSSRIEYLKHNGTYLLILPTPVTPNAFTRSLANDPNETWNQTMGTLTIDFIPDPKFTFRLEYNYRKSNLPYYAGSGGTVNATGWKHQNPPGWEPDLRKQEHTLCLALGFRL